MRASSTPDLTAEYAAVLDGFGLSGADLSDGDAEGDPSPRSVARGIDPESPRALIDDLRTTLANSTRGIESERHYWTQAPAFQLSDVLEPYGYSVSFESPDGDRLRAEGPMEVVLDGPTTTRRMTFSYPDGEFGSDNYPALVGAVESRLLDGSAPTFVRLVDDGDHWRFLACDPEDLAELRGRFGERIELGGRPLLAERQPGDFAADVGAAGEDDVALIGDLDTVVAASGIDDVFESIEREAATGPVVRTPDGGTDPGVELADMVESAGDERVTTDVRDVSGDRLDEVVEKLESDPAAIEAEINAFEWLSVPDEAEESPVDPEHVPSPARSLDDVVSPAEPGEDHGDAGSDDDRPDRTPGPASTEPSRETAPDDADGDPSNGAGDATGRPRTNPAGSRKRGREGGLSSQVAETLFGDDAAASAAGGSGTTADAPAATGDPEPAVEEPTDAETASEFAGSGTASGEATPAVEPSVEDDDAPSVTIRRREGTTVEDDEESDADSDSRIGRLTDSINRLL